MLQNDSTSVLDLSTIVLRHAASLFFVSTVSTSSINMRSSATVGTRNGVKTPRSNRFACHAHDYGRIEGLSASGLTSTHCCSAVAVVSLTTSVPVPFVVSR
jgi:hypothetical protein